MTRVEALQMAAQSFVGTKNEMMSTDELQALLENAKSIDERDFYVLVYNYLLGKRQQEVMANERY